MDDDIRNRFRGVRSQPSQPQYSRPPVRPVASPPSRSAPVRPSAPVPATPTPKAKPVLKKQRTGSRFAFRKKGRKKSAKRKLLFIGLLIVLLGLAAAFGYEKYSQKAPVAQSTTGTQTITPTEEPKPTGTVRFIAVGDSLAFESVNTSAKKADGSYDYLPMMSDFKPFFDKADIRLCNQTTPAGGDKNGLAISGFPTFNAPTELSAGFGGLGCNLINLASDHINDKGQPAIDATLASWDSQKNILAIAGANRSAEEQAKIRYFTVKQIKFAYLAYTTNNLNKQVSGYGVNMYSDDLANAQIAEARKNNAQLVIVSMNWGTENSADINADQERIAANLAAQNVDVIIGGGPRVIQTAKVLDGKEGHQTLVWFSLGNFLNSSLPIDNLIGGMAIMDFDVATHTLRDPKLLPVYMHYEWTAAQKAAGTINARNNLKLYPLDLAAEALARSQNGTTVDAQTSRVTGIITKFAPIKVIKSTEF